MQVWRQLVSRSECSCSQAVCKPAWHIPLLCVQWKTPDDGQRNCPKHVESHSKNKFAKLVHLVGFIIRNLSRFTVTWTSKCRCSLPEDGSRAEIRLWTKSKKKKRERERKLNVNYSYTIVRALRNRIKEGLGLFLSFEICSVNLVHLIKMQTMTTGRIRRQA